MPITIFSTTPKTTYTENSPISLAGVTAVGVLHRFTILDAIDFNDLIVQSNGNFGYTLSGGVTGAINATFRTNGQNVTSTIATGLTAGDEVSIYSVSTIGVDVKHYVDGILVATTPDASSTAYFGNWQAYFQGSSTGTRKYEITEKAVWIDTTASISDVAGYPDTTPLADFVPAPLRSWSPAGTNGAYAPVMLAETGGVDMNKTSGPSSGGLEPVYSGASEFISIDFDPTVCQRSDDSGYTGVFSGSWGFPSSPVIQFRVQAGGITLQGLDWQAPASLTVGVDTWQGTIGHIPVGTSTVIQVRNLDIPDAVGASSIFSVGAVVELYGQSLAAQMPSSIPTVPVVTPNADALFKDGGVWQQNGSAAQHMANRINDYLGVPVGIVVNALGGTAITLLKPGSLQWDTVVAPDMASTRGMEAMIFIQGQSDINTDPATYKTDLSEVQAGCYALSEGRDSSTLDFYVSQVGLNVGNVDNVLWPQMRNTQKDYCADTVGAYLAATSIDIEMIDDLHHTANGYAILADRITKTLGYNYGASAVNGVGSDASSFSVNGNTCVVSLQANGASGYTKATASLATGWQVYADDTLAVELTITDVQIAGNTVVITTTEVPTELSIVRHMYYSDPDISNLVYATGYDIDNIGLQQISATYRASLDAGGFNGGLSLGLGIGLTMMRYGGGAGQPSPPESTLYVNHELAGGTDLTAPPTSHGSVFSTTTGIQSTEYFDGFHEWLFNDEEALGRGVLSYDLFANNPGLTVGNAYVISYECEKIGAGNYGAALAVTGLSNVTVNSTDTVVTGDSTKRVSITFTVDDATFAASFRFGCGTTSDNTAKLIYREPRLETVQSFGDEFGGEFT